MKKKTLWIIIGIAIILLLIIAAFIVKQVNGSGKKTVKVTIHIQLKNTYQFGKASPKSVKHTTITVQLEHF